MPSCGALSGGLSADCKPAATGVKPKLVLINYDDIAGHARHSTVLKAILALNLVSGKKGFLFEGLEGVDASSNAVRVDLNPGKFSPGYTHEIDLIGFTGGPVAAAAMLQRMEELAFSRVVGVIPDNNGQYKILGLNAGMVLSAGKYDSEDADTRGVAGTLTSSKETGREDLLMVYTSGGTPVYDPIATKAAFEALYD